MAGTLVEGPVGVGVIFEGALDAVDSRGYVGMLYWVDFYRHFSEDGFFGVVDFLHSALRYLVGLIGNSRILVNAAGN